MAHEGDLFDVPDYRVQKFFGRQKQLEEILSTFSSSSSRHTAVIRALGGQGKTQLALEVCQRLSSTSPHAIFWVTADTEESVKSKYQSIANTIKLKDSAPPKGQPDKIDYVRNTFRDWHFDWVIVFDNYDNRARDFIRDYIPNCDHGIVIITTRCSSVLPYAEGDTNVGVDLQGLDQAAARNLLLHNASISPQSAADCIDAYVQPDEAALDLASEVVENLGYHALAIAQAAACIKRSGDKSLESFIHDWKKHKMEILKDASLVPAHRTTHGASGEVISEGVWVTLDLSLKQLEEDGSSDGREIRLLQLLAFFGNDRISEKYLSQFTLLSESYTAGDDKAPTKRPALGQFHGHAASSISVPQLPDPSKDSGNPLCQGLRHSICGSHLEALNWLRAFCDDEGSWDTFNFTQACNILKDRSLIESHQKNDAGHRMVTLHPLVREYLQLRVLNDSLYEAQMLTISAAILVHATIDGGISSIDNEVPLSTRNEELLQISGFDTDYEVVFKKGIKVGREIQEDYLNATRGFAGFLSQRGWHALSTKLRKRVLQYMCEIYGPDKEETLHEIVETIFECFFAQNHDEVDRLTSQLVQSYDRLMEGKSGALPLKESDLSGRQSLFWVHVIRGDFPKAQRHLRIKDRMLFEAVKGMNQEDKSVTAPGDYEDFAIAGAQKYLAAKEKQYREKLESRLHEQAQGLSSKEIKDKTSTWHVLSRRNDYAGVENSAGLALMRNGIAGLNKALSKRMETKLGSETAEKNLFDPETKAYKENKTVDFIASMFMEKGSSFIRLPDAYDDLRHGHLFLMGFYLLQNMRADAERWGFHSLKVATKSFGDESLLMKLGVTCFIIMIRRSYGFYDQAQLLLNIALDSITEESLKDPDIMPWALVAFSLCTGGPLSPDSTLASDEGAAAAALKQRLSEADTSIFPKLFSWLRMIVAVLQGLSLIDERVELERLVMQLSTSKLGTDHPMTISSKQQLAVALHNQYHARLVIQDQDQDNNPQDGQHDKKELKEAVQLLSDAQDMRIYPVEKSMREIIIESRKLWRRYTSELEGEECERPDRGMPLPFIRSKKADNGQSK